MKLYIAEACINYEGGTLIGVFTTIKEAKKASEDSYKVTHYYVDFFTISEVELGIPTTGHLFPMWEKDPTGDWRLLVHD